MPPKYIYIVHLLLEHRTQLTVTHSSDHRNRPMEPTWR
jgi:hypothetical protein